MRMAQRPAITFLSSLMTHSFIRWVGRRCLRWLYRERCFVGLDRIPATGPVLLIGNHPNDIPDVLCGFLTTPRPLRYVATISGATSGASQAAYRGLGVIPVVRVRDARKMRQHGLDAAAMNVDAFRAVGDALREGAIVGVFPEGGVHDGPHLGHFRAGVAKMALESTLDGKIKGLQIVAFGVQYEAARTPRSDLLVHIGEPFSLDEWLRGATAAGPAGGSPEEESAHTPDRKAARLALGLRDRMRDALLNVTRNAPTRELADARERMTAVLSALRPPAGSGGEAGLLLARAAGVQRTCGELVESTTVADVVLVAQIQQIAAAVARAGGVPASARDNARVLAAAGVPVDRADAAWPTIPGLIVRAPLAALGWLVHGPIFALIWRMARRSAASGAELMARACVPGLYLIFAWYLLWGVLLTVGLIAAGRPAGWIAIVVSTMLAAFPRFGDVAVRWRDDWRAVRLRGRVEHWPDEHRDALRTTADAVRAAWTPGISRNSSAFVKVDRAERTAANAGGVAPVIRTES